MCYTKKLRATAADLQLHYKSVGDDDFIRVILEHYQKGFDFPDWPIMTKDGIMWGKWGLLPNYVQTPEQIKAYRTQAYGGLNAKTENLAGVWSQYEQNRCLVPVTHFKEWRHEEVPGRKTPKKIPYDVVTGYDIASIAGIYNDWKSPEGKVVRTYAILTTAANKPMEFVHNTKKRMPVFIRPEDYDLYLSGAPADRFAFPGYEVSIMFFEHQE